MTEGIVSIDRKANVDEATLRCLLLFGQTSLAVRMKHVNPKLRYWVFIDGHAMGMGRSWDAAIKDAQERVEANLHPSSLMPGVDAEETL